MCTCEATYSGSSTTLATITYPSPSAMLLLPRSQSKQRSRPLLPIPHMQDRDVGWAHPYSSASSSRRPPSPTAAWRAASLVTSSCKKYTINRQMVSEVHFHSKRSLELTEIHTSNEVTKILKSTTWCRRVPSWVVLSAARACGQNCPVFLLAGVTYQV